MKKYAIIVAGGSGIRMNADIPKQFLLLAGKPILMYTINRFIEADRTTEIIVVIPEKEFWKKLCDQHAFAVPHVVIEGGDTRFHSVKNGLDAVKGKSIVAIHDGARPFANKELINRCFREAGKYGSAVPTLPFTESMRKVEGEHSAIADRSSFVLVQTPQCFDSEILKEAYRSGYQPAFTDDASVVESSGKKIHLVPGERENIKITYPVDLVVGEAILKKVFRKQTKK